LSSPPSCSSQALRSSAAGPLQVSAERFELIEPRVDVIEDVAVMPFNFVSYGGNENAKS
jgi:hypothetical protein